MVIFEDPLPERYPSLIAVGIEPSWLDQVPVSVFVVGALLVILAALLAHRRWYPAWRRRRAAALEARRHRVANWDV